MTEKEFVTWLKGFVQASNSYNITPKQWDDIKETLKKTECENLKITRYNLDQIESTSSTYDFKKLLHD